MQIIKSVPEMQKLSKDLSQEGKKIGLVPTMGFLHNGHKELMLAAKRECNYLVVSIFVNPLQFGPNEDFAHYPRDIKKDIALCQDANVDILFTPETDEIIGESPLSYVNIKKLDQYLCGATRSGHFRGVCTIVSKLFNIVQPQASFFGKKDIQQLKIIERMVKDLNYLIKIVGIDTIRCDDGLALSSRNTYLNPEERKAAIIVPKTIDFIKQKIKDKTISRDKILKSAYDFLSEEPLAKIDYLEIVDSKYLQPSDDFNQEIIIAAAIYIGKTRLIDNQVIQPV